MEQLIGNFRTMFLFRGIAAILFGILTFVWPKLTLSVLVLLFGLFAVISGITAVAAALRNTEEQGWGLLLFEGILGILAGVIALVWPAITAVVFLYLLAAWAIIIGIMELIAPLSFPMRGGRAVLTALAGLVSIVFGILIASQPAAGLLTVVWLIGVYAIVFGVMYLIAYFQARSLATSLA
ncbi:MAG: HdeD family acid-resistance protein [Ktedonobacteraceae bacterium]|nr:HdeD family acid-resistance protein [Ktedonobacteraceae bacterium]MBV9019698.1 HdeD family acid-resistance protein [Ktedonobacteraceae bacterium]